RMRLAIGKADARGLAAAVGHSPIRYAVVAALDNWADSVTFSQTWDAELIANLLTVSRLADPDPWRDRFRRPAIWKSATDLKKLAAEVDPSKHSPSILASLAYRLWQNGEDPAPLLRAALNVYPGDYWLHFDLANVLKEPAARAAHYHAALAIR